MERITLTSLLLTAVVSLSAGALRQYHFVNERKSWTEAQQHCRGKYTDLATITDTQDQNDAERVIKSVDPNAERVWIGLKKTNTWIWSLNDPTFYTANESQYRNWAPEPAQHEYKAQPEGDGDCVFMMKADGQWHDAPCSSIRPFICYNASSETFIPVNETKTWTEAQSYCRYNHTDLASVRNQSENDEIKNIINQNLTSSGGAWIGLSRLWVWSDNSTSTFTHWYTDEPNIKQNREDVCTSSAIQYQGRWVDDPCTGSYPFVCYDDKLVLIRKSLTWTEALKYCRDKDMDLVSVDSLEIQLRVKNVSSTASTAHVWLGLRHSCVLGLWFWVNGQTLCYDHWAPGHGTGEEDCTTTVRSGAIQTSNQRWISLPETEKNNFICTK